MLTVFVLFFCVQLYVHVKLGSVSITFLGEGGALRSFATLKVFLLSVV